MGCKSSVDYVAPWGIKVVPAILITMGRKSNISYLIAMGHKNSTNY